MNHSIEQFRKIFWFCVVITVFGMTFLACLVWLPIPEENIRFADVILGFITGTFLSGAIGYLLGGSPDKSIKSHDPGVTTVEIDASITKSPNTE